MAPQGSTSASNRRAGFLPLILCTDCSSRMVVRRVSTQPRSEGQVFYCCLDHKRDGSGCPFFRWEADYIKHILGMLRGSGNGRCDAQSEGESNLRPHVWKPNWLRADLVDYSSSTSSGGTTATTTTTTSGTATALSTPTDEMASLLSSKQGELDEAIWNMMEETSRTRLTDDDDGSWRGVQTPQGSSSDIHELTRTMVSYIVLLSTNWATAHQLVDEVAQLHGYVPRFDKVSPLTSLVMETVSCLEEKLAKKSRSFQNQSLRFLFLINNLYFIWEQLSPTLVLESHMASLARKIDNYIETYLQVSWAPVLSCLYNSTPLCMGRYSSPAKFESEFQKTYNAQKFWKVPDPKLRRRLRVAVIEKVIPNFEKYLEYNGISPSRITPHDLKDMLQELFEG